MAQQEDGWPLGLQRLNRSIGLALSFASRSVSFSTLLTSTATFASSSNSCSSSSFDFDIEEIEGATLENLLGATSIIHLPRRLYSSSIREPQHHQQQSSSRIKKRRTWFHSLCSRSVSDDEDHNRSTMMNEMAPQLSLGYLLEEERRAMSINRRLGLSVSTNASALY